MDDDDFTCPERSDEEMARLREQAASVLPAGDMWSCDGCGWVRKCAIAYDPYNTNGDCLLDK